MRATQLSCPPESAGFGRLSAHLGRTVFWITWFKTPKAFWTPQRPNNFDNSPIYLWNDVIISHVCGATMMSFMYGRSGFPVLPYSNDIILAVSASAFTTEPSGLDYWAVKKAFVHSIIGRLISALQCVQTWIELECTRLILKTVSRLWKVRKIRRYSLMSVV